MAPGPARAADHANLDETLPVTIEDAYVTPYNGTETQVKAVVTKSIGSFGTSYVPRRLHLNAIWFHNYDPLRGDGAENMV